MMRVQVALLVFLAGRFALATPSTFVIEDKTLRNGSQAVHLKVLRNTQTGEYVEVTLEAGGHTEGMSLLSPSDGSLRKVLLDNHGVVEDILADVVAKGRILVPYANRIKNGTYSFNGNTYYLERNEDRGASGKNGIHGYLFEKTMSVVSSQGDDEMARLELKYDFDGTDPGYPFPLSVVMTYVLDRRGFTLSFRAENRDKHEPLPWMCSWHSYFAVSDVTKAIVTVDRHYRWNRVLVTNNSYTNTDMIPTGLTEPFDGFKGDKPIGFEADGVTPRLYDDGFHAIASAAGSVNSRHFEYKVRDPTVPDTIVLQAGREFPWVQVYTGAFQQGEDAVAIEAMSSETNAWNNEQGIIVLQAGEVWTGSLSVFLEADDADIVSVV